MVDDKIKELPYKADDTDTCNLLAYCRVSTDMQSLDSQKYAIKKYLDGHKNVIVNPNAWYTEEDISGQKWTERNAFLEMLDRLDDPAVDGIIVFDLSRMNRKLDDW